MVKQGRRNSLVALYQFQFLDHFSDIDDNFELQPEESYEDLGARYFSDTDEVWGSI
jgi:hypothetical protein